MEIDINAIKKLYNNNQKRSNSKLMQRTPMEDQSMGVLLG